MDLYVKSLNELAEFYKFLIESKERIEEEIKLLEKMTYDQKSNWDDKQYELLRDGVEDFCKSSVKLLEEMESTIDYLGSFEAILDKIR